MIPQNFINWVFLMDTPIILSSREDFFFEGFFKIKQWVLYKLIRISVSQIKQLGWSVMIGEIFELI